MTVMPAIICSQGSQSAVRCPAEYALAGIDRSQQKGQHDREQRNRQQRLTRPRLYRHCRQQRPDGRNAENAQHGGHDQRGDEQIHVVEQGHQRQQHQANDEREQGIARQLADEDRRARNRCQQHRLDTALIPLQRQAAIEAQQARENQRHPEHTTDRFFPRAAIQFQREAEYQNAKQGEKRHDAQHLARTHFRAQVLSDDGADGRNEGCLHGAGTAVAWR